MIPVAEPSISDLEQEYVAQAIRSGWVSGGGPFVDRFERMLCEATGAAWAVAVMSGTAALHVAVTASMETLVTTGTAHMRSMTFIAAANALSYCGIAPIFDDLRGEWSPDISPIGTGIIDAAPGLGRVRPARGVYSCLSFNGNKIVTTGQGGAIIGISPWQEDVVRKLADVCKVPSPDHYEHDGIGFNYRMPNINAAFGCAQMERLPDLLARKREIFRRYRDAGLDLLDSDWLAIWNAGDRANTIVRLADAGIDAKPFWKPLHLQRPYQYCQRGDMTRTLAIWDRLVCLPCSVSLTEADQDKVINACVGSR